MSIPWDHLSAILPLSAKDISALPKWVDSLLIFTTSMAVFQAVRAAIMARIFYPRLSIICDTPSLYRSNVSLNALKKAYGIKIENKGYNPLTECQIRIKIIAPNTQVEDYIYVTELFTVRPKDDGDFLRPIFYSGEDANSFITIVPFEHMGGKWVMNYSNNRRLDIGTYRMIIEVIALDSIPDSRIISISHGASGWTVNQEKKPHK